jgi:uncharacterized protein
MPRVICDSSTLIHLSEIGRLSLLYEFFGELTVPTAVWREVVEQGRGRPGVEDVEAALREGWIRVEKVSRQPFLQSLKHELDDGEAEVIALAVESQADLVLLDESEARRVAELFDLQKTGAIGILLRARTQGKIPRLKPELDRLRASFWIDDKLYESVLRSVGEG